MKNLWNDNEANVCGGDPLKLRVYSSQLLGRDSDLVLYGGGNTSVKGTAKDFFGQEQDVLYVKGSGCDLKTIGPEGFCAVRMDVLKRAIELEQLSDSDMVDLIEWAKLDRSAPTASVETLLHAIIPDQFVDHTHADAVVTITNTPNGKALIQEIYGDRIFIVPYIKAGFLLAKWVYEHTRDVDFSKIEGMILLNHGIFTFGKDARQSYDRMIDLVNQAESYLKSQGKAVAIAPSAQKEDLRQLAQIRKQVSALRGQAMIARLNTNEQACGFSQLKNAPELAQRGPLTPDHVIRTKPLPVIIQDDIEGAIRDFGQRYRSYFDQYTDKTEQILDPAPRWCVWVGRGTVSFGENFQQAKIVDEIAAHTVRAIQQAESIDRWKPVSQQEIFAIEYWQSEQAKLQTNNAGKELAGKIAIVTGAASGIGLACVQQLLEAGVAVMGLDLSAKIKTLFDQNDFLGVQCNVTDETAVKQAVEETVRRYGGLDMLISNAGIFNAGKTIADMDTTAWDLSMDVNLTSHQRILSFCIPYLKEGIDPTVLFIGSRNVHAPGAGAASYSVPKAGLTQLARIAALELAEEGIRVNVIHPDSVFDTALWTKEALDKSASRYQMTVDEYKAKNLLKTQITSQDVGQLVRVMAGKAFMKTTGAQVPIDGGNDRVI
ncbi:MAG: bifunctional aldolase/short-chain dehydrogenase [Planctomycetes bacterium]|nr:bifunctional aldolase/short-chain dehydrogenase [Planctomycetota bacterium]